MLKQRVLTALILIPLFVTLVFSLPALHFAVLTGLIVFWCAWEWSSLLGVKSRPKKLIYPLILTALLGVTIYLFYRHFISVTEVLIAAAGWWLLASVLVVLYPKLSSLWAKSIVVKGLMGVMVLIPCWVALVFIRIYPLGDPFLVLYLFVLIWGADSGAYFAGKLMGKHKLMPQVSPGKTWEGLLGAFLTLIAIVIIPLLITRAPSAVLWIGFLFSILILVISVLGDLFESMLKRNAGVKDSGTLLPGHGGILDRIDSLTSAAPIFALSILVIEKNRSVIDWLNSINW
jgi:phosphatidate cytidylyltransferase